MAIRMPNSSDTANTVTVIIPNWNGMAWLERCLAALHKQTLTGAVVILVDNGSTDGSLALVRKGYPTVRVIELGRNTGFAHAVNVGIRTSESPYVVLLNTDTEVHAGWLAALVTCIERAPPDVAAVSSQMLMMDDPALIDDAGDELSWYGAATKRGHARSARDFGAACEIFSPSAGASLYRRSFLQAVGGFDEDFFAYLEDVDLGLRGRLLGYRYLYEPRAQVQHKGHGSGILRTSYVELMTRNRLLLFCKNVPLALLLRQAPEILFGQIYFLLVYARPWSSLKGYASFMATLPAVCRKRREIARQMTIDRAAVSALLGNTPPQPSLWSCVCARVTRAFRVRAEA
jgi:GT2 family glycosyltransferase